MFSPPWPTFSSPNVGDRSLNQPFKGSRFHSPFQKGHKLAELPGRDMLNREVPSSGSQDGVSSTFQLWYLVFRRQLFHRRKSPSFPKPKFFAQGHWVTTRSCCLDGNLSSDGDFREIGAVVVVPFRPGIPVCFRFVCWDWWHRPSKFWRFFSLNWNLLPGFFQSMTDLFIPELWRSPFQPFFLGSRFRSQTRR